MRSMRAIKGMFDILGMQGMPGMSDLRDIILVFDVLFSAVSGHTFIALTFKGMVFIEDLLYGYVFYIYIQN